MNKATNQFLISIYLLYIIIFSALCHTEELSNPYFEIRSEGRRSFTISKKALLAFRSRKNPTKRIVNFKHLHSLLN
ncbi:unnamed protein product, partial [Iphiclides podalirius]